MLVVVVVIDVVVVVSPASGSVEDDAALLDFGFLFGFGVGIFHLSAYRYCPCADTRPVALHE